MAKHYVGEIGTELTLDTGVLIGSATSQYIIYLKPDGTTAGSFSASLYSSYSLLAEAIGTYYVQHTLVAGDFDQPGDWRFQAFASSPSGAWYGELVQATVFDTYA